MKVEFKYAGSSAIASGLTTTEVAFATNQLREATYFRGKLGRPLLFREALAALYDVVVSDLKYRPRDRVEFRAWLEEQDRKFLASLATKGAGTKKRIEEIEARVAELDAARRARLAPFHKARLKYFEYVYEHQYELDYILDPVITVHPDEVAFEAFSRDESSYGRLAREVRPLRQDRRVRVRHDEHRLQREARTASSIACALPRDAVRRDAGRLRRRARRRRVHKEKKIDLPDSWVIGFLQVHSTMAMGLTRFTIAPIDLSQRVPLPRAPPRARSRRARSATSCTPGKPMRVVLEPWEHTIELSPASVYEGRSRRRAHLGARPASDARAARAGGRARSTCTSPGSACRASTCATSASSCASRSRCAAGPTTTGPAGRSSICSRAGST